MKLYNTLNNLHRLFCALGLRLFAPFRGPPFLFSYRCRVVKLFWLLPLHFFTMFLLLCHQIVRFCFFSASWSHLCYFIGLNCRFFFTTHIDCRNHVIFLISLCFFFGITFSMWSPTFQKSLTISYCYPVFFLNLTWLQFLFVLFYVYRAHFIAIFEFLDFFVV